MLPCTMHVLADLQVMSDVTGQVKQTYFICFASLAVSS